MAVVCRCAGVGVPERQFTGSVAAPSDAGVRAASPGHRNAPEEISKIIDTPVALRNEVLRGDTRLTQRWAHGEIHDHLPGMSGHVVMTFYGAAQEINWRSGAGRLASRTRPGSITLIPEGHDGHWDIKGPVDVSHVYLTEQRLQNCVDLLAGGQRIELRDRVGFDDAATAHILEMLSHAAVTGDPASRLFVEQAVDLLCTQLIRAHSSIGIMQQAEPRRGLADWQVRRVTDYMRDFIDRDIGLDELASLVGLSRFHFCTAFRTATGTSPHHHLTGLRMAKARKLLAEADVPIIQVALAVGYQTPSAFTATFRKANKLTPSEFRRGL
jgi:AraC family transcriptional regulator